MVYFIRRFLKGQRHSGTKDIWTADEPMTDEDFQQFASLYGEGKYLMCVRGVGIRGFKKLAESIVHPKHLVFSAEENVVAVKSEVIVSDLSNTQLVGAVEQSAEGEDMKPLMAEIENRLNAMQQHGADDVLVSAGFPVGSKITTFMLGALSGGVVVYLINKQKIDNLNHEIAELKNTVHKAEESIKKIEKKTESLRNPMTFEQSLMRNYNQTQGYY
jgi:hypothetical protein